MKNPKMVAIFCRKGEHGYDQDFTVHRTWQVQMAASGLSPKDRDKGFHDRRLLQRADGPHRPPALRADMQALNRDLTGLLVYHPDEDTP